MKKYHMKNTRKKEKIVSAVDIKEAMHKNATTCHCTYPSFSMTVLAHIFMLLMMPIYIKFSFVCAVSVET